MLFIQNLTKHPLFLVGFRPLFTLAMISGALLPLIWGLVFSGSLSGPKGVNPLSWHAHEMFYGFGWAVLGGFLLTASKNWVGIRGIHGMPLLLLSLFWIFERLLLWRPELLGSLPFLRVIFLNAYMVGVSGYVLWSLWHYRKTDTFSDNFLFFIVLSLFVVAKNLLLVPDYYALGLSMTVGLFRAPFAIMFERTITQFMKRIEGVDILREKKYDYAIKAFIILSVFESFLPNKLGGSVLFIAGCLFLSRLFFWKPLLGLRNFGIAIMFVGYFALGLHLLLEGLLRWGIVIGSQTTPLHIFTIFTMGVVIAGMLIRICQGHTGRKAKFLAYDKTAISCIFLAGFFRLIVPAYNMSLYRMWISISALLWALCFFLLAIKLMPFLFRPRIDGREY